MASSFPFGTEQRVNDTVTGYQLTPSETALADGGWVVLWVSKGQDGADSGVYQKRYAADGSVVMAETRVNTTTYGRQEGQDAIPLRDGGWLVTWSSTNLDTGTSEIYQQRYAVDGQPVGGEIRVCGAGQFYRQETATASLDDGGWLVTWTSLNQDGSSYGIYQQRFDESGAAVGAEQRVNSTTPSDQAFSDVAGLPDGGWVVTWASDGQDSSAQGIYQQRFDADGQPVGVEIQVHTRTKNSQVMPSVAALADGGWVVAWQSGFDGARFNITQQRYDVSGHPVGEEQTVNTLVPTGVQYPAIAALPDGGWVVAYGNDESYLTRFDASGAVVGSQVRVNTGTDGKQYYNDVVALADGGWVVSWMNPQTEDVYLQRYAVNTAPAVASAIPDQTSPEDAPWSFVVPSTTFSDREGQPLTYAASLESGAALPIWLSFDPATRTFTGTPPLDQSGELSLKVTAFDGELSSSEVFKLTITPVNDAPIVANPVPDREIIEDAFWSFEVAADTFTDVDSATLTYAARLASGADLPSWLAFDPATRTFSGQPPANFNGVIELEVTASDGASSASDRFTITFNPVNDVPIARTDRISVLENETIEANVLANDSDVDIGQKLTVIDVYGPSGKGVVGQEIIGTYGSLTLQADGSYSYAAKNTTLPEGQTATETFAYTIYDWDGGFSSADIIVTVTGGRPLPPGDGHVWGNIGANMVSEATGDFDGNGALDILWRNSATSEVALWTSDATGAITVTSLGTVGSNWTVEAVGNLDGRDGDDIVFRDAATGDVGAWIMRNGGKPSDWRALGTLSPEWDIAGTGDVDHNGTADLVLFDTDTGAVDVWLQTESGPGTRATIGTVATGWAVAGIGDLDGDGTDDVLLFNATTRQVGAWQLSEGKIVGRYDYGTLNPGWVITEIGNFDGKGPDDIGFYNATTGADGAWVMSPGHLGDWLAKPAHDALDPIGSGRFASSTDQIVWHNTVTGAVVTF